MLALVAFEIVPVGVICPARWNFLTCCLCCFFVVMGGGIPFFPSFLTLSHFQHKVSTIKGQRGGLNLPPSCYLCSCFLAVLFMNVLNLHFKFFFFCTRQTFVLLAKLLWCEIVQNR